MEENIFVTRWPKTFYFDFDWPKNVDENLEHEIEFVIKSNESLAKNKKMRINNYYSNVCMETIFMNMENSKTNKPHKVALNLSQSLDLKSTNKYVSLQNLSVYWT